MAYMKDKNGRRLDSIESVAKEEVARPADAYRFLLTGKQLPTTGSARAYSGKGGDAFPPTSTYGPRQITTGAGTGLGVCVASHKSTFDLATQSVIVAFVVNGAQPGAVIRFMGNADSTANRGFSS